MRRQGDGATCVLDASALLAMLVDEAGGTAVEPLLTEAAISTVNWTEVLQRAFALQVETEGMRADLEAVGLRFVPFTVDLADTAAQLWTRTRQRGLSLGDRACLALAAALGVPAITTDRAWEGLRLGVSIRVVR